MAGVFLDNFGWYTKSQLLRYWSTKTENGTILIGPYGRSGGPGLRFQGDSNLDRADDVTKSSLSTSGAVVVLQEDFRISAYPTVNNIIFGFKDGGSFQCTVVINTDGTLSLYRSDTTGTLLGTSTYVVPTNTHIHIGVRVLIDNSGTYRIHVYEDGDTAARVVLSGSGDTQQTGAAQWNGLHLGAGNDLGTTDHSNLVVMDGSGSYNNDLLGPADVWTRLPNGAGDHSDFTPSTGSDHVAVVNDASADDDIAYLQADTGDETLEFEDAPFPDRAVFLSELIHVARASGSGSVNVARVARQDVTDTVSTPDTLTSDYAAYFTMYDTAPDSTPWTAAIWNAMQWGAEV